MFVLYVLIEKAWNDNSEAEALYCLHFVHFIKTTSIETYAPILYPQLMQLYYCKAT